MNHLLGGVVMALALLLANPMAVAQEPGVATPASATTTDPVPSLEGSMWEGTDSQGDFAQYTFLKGGQLRVRSANVLGTELETTETKGDTWAQDGSSIRFEMNHFVTYVGTIAADHISGNATTVDGGTGRGTSRGQRWLPNPCPTSRRRMRRARRKPSKSPLLRIAAIRGAAVPGMPES